MPHFFLVLSVNGSGPNSLSGGNDSGKFGTPAEGSRFGTDGFISVAMPSAYRRFNRRLMKAWTACFVVVIPCTVSACAISSNV